jgi:hypothetical protein
MVQITLAATIQQHAARWGAESETQESGPSRRSRMTVVDTTSTYHKPLLASTTHHSHHEGPGVNSIRKPTSEITASA